MRDKVRNAQTSGRSVNGRERGATAVELALFCSFFFVFTFTSFQLILAFFTKLSLQYAAAATVREAIVWQGDPGQPKDPQARARWLKGRFATRIAALGIPAVALDKIHVCDLGALSESDTQVIDRIPEADLQCTESRAAGPGSMVSIYLRYPYKWSGLGLKGPELRVFAVGRAEVPDYEY